MPLFKSFSPRATGLLAAVVTVLVWTAFIVISRATADPTRGGALGPFDIVLARILGASAILLPLGFVLVRKDRAQGIGASSLFGFSPLPLRLTVGAGLFGGLLYGLFAYNGFAYAPAMHASVLLPGSLPLWTALLAAWMLRTRITRGRAIGLALIVVGDVLVGGSSLLHALDGGNIWIGDLLFMVAALCWSVYSVLARRHALDAVRATVAITAFAFFVYVPLYGSLLLAQQGGGNFLRAPRGVLSVVVAGISFTKMIQHYGPVRSTMITALVPGLSAFAAVMFLGEPPAWNLLLGLLLVTVGILFGVRAVAVAPALAVPDAAR